VVGRRVDDIKGKPECLVKHLWDNACKEGADQFETGVGVYLNEIGLKLTVNHKIQPEYLEVMLAALRR
jgi:hypothetical protein